MGLATVTFRRCIQNSKDAGSSEKHIASRIYFDLELDGHHHTDICVDVKHPSGKTSPLEVSLPHGYTGPGEFEELRDAAAAYYKKITGNIARSGKPAANNLIVQDEAVKFEV
ncbi:MAG: hypothetical protein FD165_366 [Gammaproteobacteria bacterium]|nr:MAG: hypothetical protein FD165_366 [Gammaproteobacteria bacterium]TND04815.1 MAG: hypothetical protein FD120_1382 [Gammaproteobacteria bacterium]